MKNQNFVYFFSSIPEYTIYPEIVNTTTALCLVWCQIVNTTTALCLVWCQLQLSVHCYLSFTFFVSHKRWKGHTYSTFNMKQAAPRMLANLKIIFQFHTRAVHQNSVEIFWAEIYRGRLFLGSNLDSFNRTLVVPYEISTVNFHAEFDFLVSVSEEIY